MCHRKFVLVGTAAILAAVVLLAATPSSALIITPTYTPGHFTEEELKVLAEAVKEWADLFKCSDGQRIPITFLCGELKDKDGNPIAGDTLTNFSITGTPPVGTRVTGAEVTLNNNALYWNLKEPGEWPAGTSAPDALTAAKHEVGHALGFIDEIESEGETVRTGFGVKVKTAGGYTFYDSNNNGTYDAGTDFRLDGSDPSHAFSNTDVMYSTLDNNTRMHPTLMHAKVLSDAYGYCVVPEPASLLIWLLLAASFAAGGWWRRSARS
jgi:hypothetical protein